MTKKKSAPKTRNSEFAQLRSQGALRQRVIRNKKHDKHRDRKHKGQF